MNIKEFIRSYEIQMWVLSELKISIRWDLLSQIEYV